MPKHGSAWLHSSSDSNAKNCMKGESDRARIIVPPPLLGSGFQSASTNRAPSVLDKVQIVGVDNGQTGELKVRIDPIANAKGFDGRNPGSVSTSRRFHSRTRNRSCSKASLRGSPTRCNCVPSVAAPVQAIGAIQYRTWRCNCEGAQRADLFFWR